MYIEEVKDVKTCLNSGNVTFSSDKDDTEKFMPPITFAEVYSEIGEPKEELERIKNY